MGKSIGLLELKSIPAGLETADEMLKSANVELLLAAPTCPGKFVIVVSGDIGAVKSSVESGTETADNFLLGDYIINNVHDDLPAAMIGTNDVDGVLALGAMETMSAMSVIMAGDIAAKAADIELIEVRIAKGLGGKGYLLISGEISSVKAAMDACIHQLGDTGEITSTCVIPSPDQNLVEAII